MNYLSLEGIMKNSLLDSITAILPLVVEKCEALSFTTSFPGDESLVFCMPDMQDPATAQNKCSRVTETIVAEIDFSSLLPGLTAKFTGIQSPAGNHYAVLLSQEGEPEENSVILDFTARQFGADAEFPLVMDCWKWQVWTEGKLGRQGNWYHSYAW